MLDSMLTWNWDFWCNVAGAICIIGPLFLVGWYYKAVKVKIKKLHDQSQ